MSASLLDARLQCAFMLRHARRHHYRNIDALFAADPELFLCLSVIFRQFMSGNFIQ